MALREHQSIYPCGSVYAAFDGPENAVTVVITDLRAATTRGDGIVIHRGKKKHPSYREAETAARATIAKMVGHTAS